MVHPATLGSLQKRSERICSSLAYAAYFRNSVCDGYIIAITASGSQRSCRYIPRLAGDGCDYLANSDLHVMQQTFPPHLKRTNSSAFSFLTNSFIVAASSGHSSISSTIPLHVLLPT